MKDWLHAPDVCPQAEYEPPGPTRTVIGFRSVLPSAVAFQITALHVVPAREYSIA